MTVTQKKIYYNLEESILKCSNKLMRWIKLSSPNRVNFDYQTNLLILGTSYHKTNEFEREKDFCF